MFIFARLSADSLLGQMKFSSVAIVMAAISFATASPSLEARQAVCPAFCDFDGTITSPLLGTYHGVLNATCCAGTICPTATSGTLRVPVLGTLTGLIAVCVDDCLNGDPLMYICFLDLDLHSLSSGATSV